MLMNSIAGIAVMKMGNNCLSIWPYGAGRAMSVSATRRPLTAEAPVRAQVNPCWICGGQGGTGTGISPSSLVFPCQSHSTVALHAHISSGGWLHFRETVSCHRHEQQHEIWIYGAGRVMAQVVSPRSLTAEARVRAQVSSCGVCDGQGGTRTRFTPSSSVFSSQYHFTLARHAHISSGWWTVGPLVAAVQRHSLTSSTSSTTNLCYRFFF
jgi:tetrahydromethanopterin S-methyltransferase subunit E